MLRLSQINSRVKRWKSIVDLSLLPNRPITPASIVGSVRRRPRLVLIYFLAHEEHRDSGAVRIDPAATRDRLSRTTSGCSRWRLRAMGCAGCLPIDLVMALHVLDRAPGVPEARRAELVHNRLPIHLASSGPLRPDLLHREPPCAGHRANWRGILRHSLRRRTTAGSGPQYSAIFIVDGSRWLRVALRCWQLPSRTDILPIDHCYLIVAIPST